MGRRRTRSSGGGTCQKFLLVTLLLLGLAVESLVAVELLMGVLFCPRVGDERSLQAQLRQHNRNLAVAIEAVEDANNHTLQGTNLTLALLTANASDDYSCLEMIRRSTLR